MRRREFIKLMAGSGLAGPIPSYAQHSERVRRLAVLFGQAADDQGQARIVALTQALKNLGWAGGRNVQMDVRWGAGNAEEIRRYASELVALNPDVIMASGSPAVVSLLQAINALPIVFSFPIPSEPVSSTVSRIPAAMRLASQFLNTASGQNGWSYSKKSPPVSSELRYYGILPLPPG